MDRRLDGVYYRVKRDGKWQNICFSDLTPDEREKLLEGVEDTKYLKSLCYVLADTIKALGEQFNILGINEKQVEVDNYMYRGTNINLHLQLERSKSFESHHWDYTNSP